MENKETPNPKKSNEKKLIQKINAIQTIDDVKKVLRKIVKNED